MKPVQRYERVGNGRAGATLTEVLMSILIMAVGVVSVFTLFPISVLRTIRATQQTNSKIHKLNVQQIIKSSPGILTQFEPGGALPAPFSFQGESWRPNTAYPNGTIVVPTLKPGQLLPNPLVWYVASGTVDSNSSGFFESGANEPTWLPQANVLDGELDWQPILNAGIPISYVIDPLGFNIARDDATSPPAEFGNKTDPATGIGVTPPGGALVRIHGGLNVTAAASASVSHPDNWEEVVSATPASATDTAVTFPPSISLAGTAGATRRMVLTSTDGQMTVYRSILSIGAPTVSLAESIPARFPRDGGLNPDIGIARIEVFSRRFTWFLTVRNDASGTPDIKCVVVFNRNLGSASEHVYNANFGNPDLDVDGDGNTDGLQHGLPTAPNWVKIAWPDTEPDPLLKPGNWLFDARDVTWYRVQQVFEEGTAGGANFAVLFLDRNVRTASPAPPGLTGQAILMPGIVEVFNL